MQNQMVLSYITKLYLLFFIFFCNLYALFITRTKSFEKILSLLQKITVNENKTFVKLNFLLRYHSKICNLLGLKKCLTTSVAFFYILRNLGYAAKINISVAREEEFFSHSWISVDAEDYFRENDNLKNIITIG